MPPLSRRRGQAPLPDLFWLTTTLALRNVRGGDFQNTARVLVKTVTNFLRWTTLFFLNAHRKTLALSLPFNFRRQITMQIRTAICGVMLLITLVIAKHIDAIEVGLINAMRLI